MEVRALVRPGYCRWVELDPIGELLTRPPATWKTTGEPWEVVHVDPMLDAPAQDGGRVWLPEIPDDAVMVQVIPVPPV